MADRFVVGAGAGAVVLRYHGAVGQGQRRDFALEESVLLRLAGAVLATHTPAVHFFASDAFNLHHVLGSLTHGQVGVGQTVRRGPGALASTGADLAAGTGLLEDFVRSSIGDTIRVAADRLNAGGNEAVSLVSLDGVEGHADGLQRR